MNKLGLPKFGWIHNPTELTHVDVEENAESNTLFHLALLVQDEVEAWCTAGFRRLRSLVARM